MPRARTNQVTSDARESLFRWSWNPETTNVPLGVHLLPERWLVAGSSQLSPFNPAPGELRKGPVSCAAACGPVQLNLTE